MNKTNDVPIIDAEGNEHTLESKYAPGFPIVVVKESLRIIEKSETVFEKLDSKTKIRTADGLEFRLLDDAFDRKLNISKKAGGRLGYAADFDSKVKNAYSIFLNTEVLPIIWTVKGHFIMKCLLHARGYDLILPPKSLA